MIGRESSEKEPAQAEVHQSSRGTGWWNTTSPKMSIREI
jgi:hypothetical protein